MATGDTKQEATPGGSRRTRGRPTLSNDQLLDKAMQLFLEQGFERTSIESIAAAAGMAKRTVYSRYPDKMSLFRATLHRAIRDWIVPIERLRASEREDFEETLLEVGRILVANIMTPEGIRLLRITNAESARMPEIGAYTYRHGTERTIHYLADLFQRRLGPDVERDWTEAAIAFLYLVVSGPPTMKAWGMTLDDRTVDSHTRFCVRLFLYGLLHAAPSVSRDLAAAQEENRRLRDMLLGSMLEASALREQIASFASGDPHVEGSLSD